MRKLLVVAVLALACVGGVPATAAAGGESQITERGRCSEGSRWRLHLETFRNDVRVRFKVNSDAPNQRWRVRVRDVDGAIVFRGIVTTNDKGNFRVRGRSEDDNDRVFARARNLQTDERCRGSALLPSA
jgi:hypothetical protein